MTNQIRITLGLQGQAQVAAALKQTAKDVTAVGAASSGIEGELAGVTAQLRAMGQAAALASQQFMQVRLEQAGLATTAGSLGQRLRQQTTETIGAAQGSAGLSRALGTVMGAARAAVPVLATLKVAALAGEALEAAGHYRTFASRIEVVSGNAAVAKERLGFLREETDRLGSSLVEGSRNFSALLAGTGGLTDAERNNIFSVLTQAGEKYKLTQAENTQNFEQMARIAGKTKITLDDLGGALGNNLPMVLDVTARGLGLSTQQLRGMIEQGELAGRDILPAIATGFSEAFGLGVQRDVNTATTEIARLKNELLLVASALSDPVKVAFTEGGGTVAGYFANLIKFGREGDKADALLAATAPVSDFAIGTLNTVLGTSLPTTSSGVRSANAARDFVQANPFRPALYNPNAPRSTRFFGPGQPSFGLVGENLLSFGQPDAADREKREREHRRGVGEALREQQRIEAELQRGREASLKNAIDEEATRLGLIRNARTEAAVIAEELRTGKALTGAARELFELKQDSTRPVDAVLEKELKHLAALEAQVKAIEDGERAAEQARRARDRADRQNEGFQRRYGANNDDPTNLVNPFQRNARVRDQRLRTLDSDRDRSQRFNDEARQAERLAGTNDEEKYRQEDLENHRAYVEEKKRIDNDYLNANLASMQAQVDGAAKVMGEIATIASVFGRKGFEAYRKIQIAQSIASTISGAIGAFMQAQKTYPPPYGQIAGAIAAAATLAAGYQQVNQLRSMQPPGRRFGGPVSAGQMVELNEGGISEVYRDARSGRQYFIPGNSGEVTPAKAMSGSMGAAAANDSRAFDSRPLIQVFEQTGSVGVRTQTQRLGRKDVVRIFVEELGDNASPVSRGVQGFSGRKVAGGVG